MFFCRSGIWSAQGAHGVSSCPRMPTTKALTAKRLMVSAKWKPHSRGEKQPKHTKAWPSMALVRGPKHTGEHTQVCAFMIHPWSMHAKRIATLTWGNQDICNPKPLQAILKMAGITAVVGPAPHNCCGNMEPRRAHSHHKQDEMYNRKYFVYKWGGKKHSLHRLCHEHQPSTINQWLLLGSPWHFVGWLTLPTCHCRRHSASRSNNSHALNSCCLHGASWGLEMEKNRDLWFSNTKHALKKRERICFHMYRLQFTRKILVEL